MTNSKKDSELEEIQNLGSKAGTGNLTYGQARAVQSYINSKYITKEESDRRVLEARIDELNRILEKEHECEFLFLTHEEYERLASEDLGVPSISVVTRLKELQKEDQLYR